MYYKSGQACVTNWGSLVLSQIRANAVTNWGSFIITNQGKRCYKLGQLLQFRATVITKQAVITNWGKVHYKLGQVLQIRANYYILGHNIFQAGYIRRVAEPIFIMKQFCGSLSVANSLQAYSFVPYFRVGGRGVKLEILGKNL